jgi:hypothetical protein
MKTIIAILLLLAVCGCGKPAAPAITTERWTEILDTLGATNYTLLCGNIIWTGSDGFTKVIIHSNGHVSLTRKF